MDKKKLRKKYLGKRLSLSSKQILDKSLKIADKVLSLEEINSAKFISCYLPIKNEVDTVPIIKRLVKMKKKVLLPSYFKNTKDYKFVEFSTLKNLDQGPFQILQPVTKNIIPLGLIDAAIIPGVAFSPEGTRLGYGKGVFDRLLVDSPAIKIGLAYDFQVVDKLPNTAHDLRMDLIVTEKRVIVHRS